MISPGCLSLKVYWVHPPSAPTEHSNLVVKLAKDHSLVVEKFKPQVPTNQYLHNMNKLKEQLIPLAESYNAHIPFLKNFPKGGVV